MDLFDRHRERNLLQKAPLADRMRPRTLDEMVGQPHILGEGKLLRRAIEADRLTSLILYGPPGSGKTALASVVARSTECHFVRLNAVMSGVGDIREVVAEAEKQLGVYSRRTILFIDEVHRFNKAQQDALLPYVEDGTVILIGATTENPYFEVIAPLVSRSRIFELVPLGYEDIRSILIRAMQDGERGLGKLELEVADEALDHIIATASGDARSALNALELGALTTEPDDDGVRHITVEVAEESIQKRVVRYDKDGDAHYDTISAFIKSMRGSDPDATLHWLARMIYAGEDPRFIARRLVVHAAEDVGLADPRALQVAVACAQAVERVGMPEGRIILAEAALYIATAPKSNSALGIDRAIADVKEGRGTGVPAHLQDSSYRGAERLGRGQDYRYPHSYSQRWVDQQYLPSDLVGTRYYDPSDSGYEARLARRLADLRREK